MRTLCSSLPVSLAITIIHAQHHYISIIGTVAVKRARDTMVRRSARESCFTVRFKGHFKQLSALANYVECATRFTGVNRIGSRPPFRPRDFPRKRFRVSRRRLSLSLSLFGWSEFSKSERIGDDFASASNASYASCMQISNHSPAVTLSSRRDTLRSFFFSF